MVHFDQLRHVPNTDWQSKPEAEINRLHDEAIAQHKWVFDGNGGSLMPSRFNRADMVIWCDPNLFGCAFRFMCRPFFKKKRHGGLVGATANIQWDVIKFIFTTYRNKNRKRYLKTIKQAQQQNPNLKFIHLTSFKEIKNYAL